MKILSFILIALLGFSCINNQSSNQSKNYSSQSYLTTLQKRKALIDRITDTSNRIGFVKMKNKSELVRLNGSFPDEGVESSYSVLMDKGKVIMIGYSPIRESDNWALAVSHYFNADGHTFAFEERAGDLDMPNNRVVYQTTTEYFDPEFKSIKYFHELVDENKKPVDRSHAFNFNNKIYPTAAKCLSAYHIKL